MKNKLLILLTAIICLCSNMNAQVVLQPTEADFDKVFEGWTDDTKPGISVAVLHKGKIDFQKSWGLANLEHQIPIDDQTVFMFPLIAEQMLSFSVLLLEERGQWSLKDHIGPYLDYLPASLKDIQIYQLLNHNSRLESIPHLKGLAGWRDTDALNSDIFNSMLNMKMACKENKEESYSYNQTGLRLLQLVLEKQTGLAFHEFAQKEIFEPLSMDKSLIAPKHKSIKNKAQGYIATGDDFLMDQTNDDYLTPDQLFTTASDILKWQDNFWRPKIGSANIWKKMDEYVLDEGAVLPERNRSLFIGQHRFWDFRGLDKYYLVGMNAGYAAKMIRYQEHDLAIVVMGNFGTYNGHLGTIASELYLENFMDKQGRTIAQPQGITVSNTELEKYCGQYWNLSGESMAQVTLENDTLRYFQELFNWKTNLIPNGQDQFFMDDGSVFTVNFRKEAEGQNLILTAPERADIVFTQYQKISMEVLDASQYEAQYTNAELGVQYEIKNHKEGIALKTKRGINIVFEPMGKDAFKSTHRIFSRINFTRGQNGEIESLQISNRFIKNIYFKQSDQKNL